MCNNSSDTSVKCEVAKLVNFWSNWFVDKQPTQLRPPQALDRTLLLSESEWSS